MINALKPTRVKRLHFTVFRTILVEPILFNFLTFGRSGSAPECQKIKTVG